MVLCKFFLQGTCKFGNTCRFEHQINDNSQGSSILRQTGQNSAPTAPMDPATLVRFVVSDMTSAEQGKQWAFSSYSPFKDKPAFPGFEDKSFEEIRLGFYEATQNGSVEQYKQVIQLWYQEALGKIRALQNPSEDIVNVLTQIYAAPVVNQSSVFQSNAGNNVFPSQTMLGGNSVFGGNNSQGGVQNNNSVFGQKSIFVNNNPSFVNNQSIFANSTGNSVFGPNVVQNNKLNPTNPIFAQNTNPGTSIFAQNTYSPPSQNSIFGNNTIFNAKQNQQPPFGIPNNPQPTNPFGNPPIQPNPFVSSTAQPSPFNTPAAKPSPFNPPTTQPSPFNISPNQQSPFGNAIPQPSPFTNNNNQTNAQPIFANSQQPNSKISTSPFQTTTNPLFKSTPPLNNNQTNNSQANIQRNTTNQPSQNIFAQNPVAGNSILNKPSNPITGQETQRTQPIIKIVREETWYSKLEELSAEDIKSFESEQFEFGKIPENPPTLQMCF